jgi:hypothetical protein
LLTALAQGCDSRRAEEEHQAGPALDVPAPPAKKERPPAPAGAASDNPLVTLVDEPGVLRGEVRWLGPVPAVPGGEEAFVTVRGKKHPVTPAPRVRVGADGGLAEVFAYLQRPPATADPALPDTVTVSQVHGRLEPRVQVAAPGSRLRLRTSDDVADLQVSGRASFARVLERGRAALVPLPRPGLVVVASEARPWLTPAHVHVLDHTFYALTGDDGRFALPRVPPGEYRLVLRHEGAPPPDGLAARPFERVVPIRLGPGQGATIRWVLP